MEPDVIEIESAAKGLAILVVIPVVAFALWADYLVKHLDQLSIKKPQIDRNIEVEKVRITSLLVILFQFSLFLGSGDIRNAYPIATQLVFILAVVIQLLSQSQIEKKIRIADKNPDDLVRLALRVGLFWAVGGALYGGVLIFSIKMASLLAMKTHATPAVGSILLLVGGGIGVIVGLGINFAFGPMYLKSMLPTQRIQDARLQTRLETCFSKAGFATPVFWIIELTALRLSNVIVVGFQRGKGALRPAVFISRPLLATLDPKELEAIVLNQISHMALHHLRKRFLFSIALVLVTTFFAVLSIFLGRVILPGHTALEILAPAIALASFFASFNLLANQAKKHEVEGDVYSIEKLGVQMDVLISALRKLFPPIAQDTMPLNVYTLENELRIEVLKKHFSQKETPVLEKESQAS